MYLMYVDESGDPGVEGHASPHYILSGLVVHQDAWPEFLSRLKSFRKSIKDSYGLNQRTEIHASELIRVNKLKEYAEIRKSDRISILKTYCRQIPVIFDTAKLINICIDKEKHRNGKAVRPIDEYAWARLVQRFDTFLKKAGSDKGIIISDDTQIKTVSNLMRKMRVYNPIPSHYGDGFYNAPTIRIIEDLFQRSSHHSYFIQTVDVVSHLLYRKEYPKGSLKKFGLEHEFQNLDPILLKEAGKNDPHGIVRK